MTKKLAIFDLDETLICWDTRQLFPQARSCLLDLRSLGFELAVASYNAHAEKNLECLGIRNLFGYIETEVVTKDDWWLIDNKKQMLLSLIEKNEGLAAQTIFFDDQMRFVESAKMLGIVAVHVKHGLTRIAMKEALVGLPHLEELGDQSLP